MERRGVKRSAVTYSLADLAGGQWEQALRLLEELEGSEPDAALRYLVTLELVRRRVLRFIDRPLANRRGPEPATSAVSVLGQPSPSADLIVACRKRDREYVVRTVSPQQVADPGVEERFTALLWSGGAA